MEKELPNRCCGPRGKAAENKSHHGLCLLPPCSFLRKFPLGKGRQSPAVFSLLCPFSLAFEHFRSKSCGAHTDCWAHHLCGAIIPCFGLSQGSLFCLRPIVWGCRHAPAFSISDSLPPSLPPLLLCVYLFIHNPFLSLFFSSGLHSLSHLSSRHLLPTDSAPGTPSPHASALAERLSLFWVPSQPLTYLCLHITTCIFTWLYLKSRSDVIFLLVSQHHAGYLAHSKGLIHFCLINNPDRNGLWFGCWCFPS